MYKSEQIGNQNIGSINNDAPERTPAVKTEMQSLHVYVNSLETYIQNLFDRLSPVLAPESPSSFGHIGKQNAVVCPLSEEISLACGRIAYAQSRLCELLARLEV